MSTLKKILVFIILVHLPGFVLSQNWNDVLNNSTQYDEVIQRAEAFFKDNGKGKGSGFKQYMRWRGEVENQISKDGKLRNFGALNLKSYQAAQKKLKASNERSTHGNWENVGPFDYYVSDSYSGGGIGRVSDIEFHPTNPQIIWIGTSAGGTWKSTDSGSNWIPKGDDLPSMGVTDIKIDYTNPNIMYILTGDGYNGHTFSVGVLKSTDGGESWNPTGLSYTPNQFIRPYVMVMDPAVPTRLHVGLLGGGIMRSVDGGATWTNVLPGWIRVWDIKYEPSDPNIMYAATSKGLYRSINNGQNWFVQPDSDFPSVYNNADQATSFSKMDIAVCPSVPGQIYAVFGGSTGINGTFYGLFRSSDYGNDFVLRSTSPNVLGWNSGGNDGSDQAWRNLEMVVDPADGDKIFVGGINLWKSNNGGTSWDRQTWFRRDDPEPYVHADMIELAFQGSTLFVTNDGGVYKSNNGGGSWTELSAGLSITQYYEIDALNNKYMGGSQDNGTTESTYPNTQFHEILGGDGFAGVWHTGNNSIQYVSTQNSIVRKQSCCCIQHSINPSGLGDGDFWFCEIEMHETNPNYVFLATGEVLYRGNGDCISFSWENLGTSNVLVEGIRDFVQGTDNTNVMYVSSRNIVLKTTNLSNSNPTWLPLNVTLVSGADATDVEVDPLNSNRVWVGTAGYEVGKKVYYSPDGGSTWNNISGSLPNVPVNSLSYDTGNGGGIYAGTDIGIFYRNNAMSDWIYFSNGFPNVRVFDMEVEAGYLYAGTFGRGIWRTPLYSACPNNLVLTPANEPSLNIGIQVYHASASIISSRIVSGGIGTDVFYQAGAQIDLIPGFEAISGNALRAKIGGCPD